MNAQKIRTLTGYRMMYEKNDVLCMVTVQCDNKADATTLLAKFTGDHINITEVANSVSLYSKKPINALRKYIERDQMTSEEIFHKRLLKNTTEDKMK